MMYYCLTGEKEQKQEQQKDISGQKKIKKKIKNLFFFRKTVIFSCVVPP